VARPIDNGPAPATAVPIAVDRKADVPVGVQLDWALCAQIREGALVPGQQLPTLRELAESTGLNVNTVRAVYRRLEQRGLIETQQGSGTFVAAAPTRSTELSSIAANAADEARATGVDPRDLAAALYVAREQPSGAAQAAEEDPAERARADRRRALRDQIATLERTVAELESEHAGVVPAPRRMRRGAGPMLLTVDELEHVRAGLIRRLTVVQSAIDEHLAEQASAAGPAVAKRKASKPGAEAKPASSRSAKQPARPIPATRPAPA
jgi:DNA-binding transcriptional regulator YhcF (GntR family)